MLNWAELIVLCLALGYGYRLLKDRDIIPTLALGLLGAFLGAFVGFLMRPAFPLVGQLDLDVVLSRGMNLTGVDRVMQSTAEQSCNYVLIGAIVGGSLFCSGEDRKGEQSTPGVCGRYSVRFSTVCNGGITPPAKG
jgi:hypothetical protein